MRYPNRLNLNVRSVLVWTVLALLACFTALPAIAGMGVTAPAPQDEHDKHGGRSARVLPAFAEPHGYSLTDMARITAAFNVGDHSEAPPRLVGGSGKFQMLFTTETNTFTVKHNTTLYVPLWVSDDSPPVVGNFPDVTNRHAVLRYIYGHRQMGLQYSTITIDGKDYSLDKDYVSAIKVPPLPDGEGTGYIVMAAFIKHLKRGQHTVEISASFTGDALAPWCQSLPVPFCTDSLTFTIKYVVNVY